MRRIQTDRLLTELQQVTAQMIAARTDAEEIVDRIKAGAVNVRLVFDKGCLSVGLVDTDGSVSVLDVLFIAPKDPTYRGVTVDDWFRDSLNNQPLN